MKGRVTKKVGKTEKERSSIRFSPQMAVMTRSRPCGVPVDFGFVPLFIYFTFLYFQRNECALRAISPYSQLRT